MDQGIVMEIFRDALMVTLILAAPVLIGSMVVGLIIAVFQAATQVSEQTLTFVPKIFVILLMLAFLGGWMFSSLREFTIQLFQRIPDMAR